MNPKVIIDGNAVYEIDEACMKKQKSQISKEKPSENTSKPSASEKK